jgi:hypothetical protein
MVRPIWAALILLIVIAGVLVAAQAQAADGNERVIALSCDGTVATVGYKTREHIKSMDVSVDVSARRVVGFGDVIANINEINAAGIAFSGEGPIKSPGQQGRRFGVTSVVGFFDRVDGAATATVTTVTAKSTALSQKYDLHCKRLSKMFYIQK